MRSNAERCIVTRQWPTGHLLALYIDISSAMSIRSIFPRHVIPPAGYKCVYAIIIFIVIIAPCMLSRPDVASKRLNTSLKFF